MAMGKNADLIDIDDRKQSSGDRVWSDISSEEREEGGFGH